MSWHVRVVPNRYADSVRLMGVARTARERSGVDRAEVAMGTDANLEALSRLGARAEATPGDVFIAVQASDDDVASEAIAEAERSLASLGEGEPEAGARETSPRSLPAAAGRVEGANVALISVPGEYAALEAHRALSAGMHVFLFSDHVPVEEEIALKRRGAAEGLLVMGPECGTAMLGGVGLGFANEVAPGTVGVVAAGGTGAQEAACLVEAAGAGVSHIIGVGGRDLSRGVGGLMTREGLRVLADDDATDTVLLVSKPPEPEVVEALADRLPRDKRLVAALVGWDAGDAPFEVHPTLEAAAYAAAGSEPPGDGDLRDAVEASRARSAGRGLRGLYSGGSLAHEAVTIAGASLGPLGGNVATEPDDDSPHAVLDLGEAGYTQGRAHPMVDLDTRLDELASAADDADVGCILLDVVLGHAAHPDPAGGLADAVELAGERALVVAHVCGTAADPQDADAQRRTLAEAGALVAPTNACAARLGVHAVEADR